MQGLNTIKSGFNQLVKNEVPIYEIISGAALAFAALLLIIPGFLTDIVGFLLIIPITRKLFIRSISLKFNRKKNKARVGKVLPVLIEGADPEEEYLVTGRLATQAPEIDGQVIIEESDVEIGQIVPMLITGSTDYDLVARQVEKMPT